MSDLDYCGTDYVVSISQRSWRDEWSDAGRTYYVTRQVVEGNGTVRKAKINSGYILNI